MQTAPSGARVEVHKLLQRFGARSLLAALREQGGRTRRNGLNLGARWGGGSGSTSVEWMCMEWDMDAFKSAHTRGKQTGKQIKMKLNTVLEK